MDKLQKKKEVQHLSEKLTVSMVSAPKALTECRSVQPGPGYEWWYRSRSHEFFSGPTNETIYSEILEKTQKIESKHAQKHAVARTGSVILSHFQVLPWKSAGSRLG